LHACGKVALQPGLLEVSKIHRLGQNLLNGVERSFDGDPEMPLQPAKASANYF